MRASATHRALAVLAGLLGVAHLALTPLVYPDWTIEALWFVGTGLAIMLAAAANLFTGPAPGPSRRVTLVAINTIMTCYFAAAWLVLPGPQVVVGGLLFLCLVLCCSAAYRLDR